MAQLQQDPNLVTLTIPYVLTTLTPETIGEVERILSDTPRPQNYSAKKHCFLTSLNHSTWESLDVTFKKQYDIFNELESIAASFYDPRQERETAFSLTKEKPEDVEEKLHTLTSLDSLSYFVNQATVAAQIFSSPALSNYLSEQKDVTLPDPAAYAVQTAQLDDFLTEDVARFLKSANRSGAKLFSKYRGMFSNLHGVVSKLDIPTEFLLYSHEDQFMGLSDEYDGDSLESEYLAKYNKQSYFDESPTAFLELGYRHRPRD